MFTLKRNQVIITALVVMIAVAGYLSYTDNTNKSDNGIALNDNGEINALVYDPNDYYSYFDDIGSELTVSDDPSITVTADYDSTTTGTGDPGEAVFVNTTSDSSYFVQAKLEREQDRAKEKEILMNMINNENIEASKKADCADAMLEIRKRIEKESTAEALIEAKGFSEVYVRIDDDGVDVVVNKEVLSDAEIAQIEDIIERKTGMSADKIHISPMRK